MSKQADELRVSQPNQWSRAHVVPFVIFMSMLLLLQFGGELFKWDHPAAPWWRRWPEQWIYPLQTLICLTYLIKHWRFYEFRWNLKWSLIGIVFGAIGIGFWLLPTMIYDYLHLTDETSGWLKWLGVKQRDDGFDPGVFSQPSAYWFSLVMRFVRATIVVALIEEIFWRGFLMRFIADMDGSYWKLPFGKHTWCAFVVCTFAFTIAHAPVDYTAALIYGSLTYLLCIISKNLGACVIMHATANFLMGCFIMAYGKFGLW
jgi:CAAX prenyl protease-like protein